MLFSVVVPTYRGARIIPELLLRVKNAFENLPHQFEVIFVFDDGPDDSWEVIKKLAEGNPGIVRGVKLNRNFGQHNATICGFKYVKGDFVITMDEDLQHDPMDIPSLIQEQQKKNYDLVYGSYIEKKHTGFRNATSDMLNGLLRFGIPDLHKDYSSFRLIRASLARQTLLMNNSYTFLDGYLTWLTRNVSSLKVQHHASASAASSYNFKKLLEHSVNIFVTFSNLPIRMITWTSLVLTGFATLYGGYILIRKLVYNDFVSGYATFAVMGSFGLAILLFSLGIIGEYVYRINLKTTQRPNFMEAEVI